MLFSANAFSVVSSFLHIFAKKSVENLKNLASRKTAMAALSRKKQLFFHKKSHPTQYAKYPVKATFLVSPSSACNVIGAKVHATKSRRAVMSFLIIAARVKSEEKRKTTKEVVKLLNLFNVNFRESL